jgi:hypothetical protein
VAKCLGTVLQGDQEGGRHYRVFGRGRREAGFGAQEPSEVSRTFETTPGMNTAGLEDPMRHAGNLFGLVAAGAAGHVEVGHLGEDLQISLNQGAAHGICPGEGREERGPRELAGNLEVPGILAGQGVAPRRKAHGVAQGGIPSGPEGIREGGREGFFASGFQGPRERRDLRVPEVNEDARGRLTTQGRAG